MNYALCTLPPAHLAVVAIATLAFSLARIANHAIGRERRRLHQKWRSISRNRNFDLKTLFIQLQGIFYLNKQLQGVRSAYFSFKLIFFLFSLPIWPD
jgi:hypothetical protein